MYKATDRMMSFVYRCVKETPAGRNMVYSTESHSFEGVDYEDCLLYTSDAVLEVQVNTTSHPDIEATLAPEMCIRDSLSPSSS